MVRKTSKYFIATLISICLLTGVQLPVAAQRPNPNPMPLREQKKLKAQEEKEPEIIMPLFNGIYAGIDLVGIGQGLFSGNTLSSELSLTANLRNKYLPTLEVGYGTQDEWSENGIHARAKAPFFRIGMDYNVLHKKKEKNSFLYAGLRYGFSPIQFDISNAPLTDPIYGGTSENPSFSDIYWGGSVPFEKSMKASLHWIEAVLGVKVQIYKNFNMGWSVRLKYKIGGKNDPYGSPDYIPGYGKNHNSNLGMTYSLIYKLPL